MINIIIFVKSDTFSRPLKSAMLYFAERAKMHKYRPFRTFSQKTLGLCEVSG
jgi:hypothetical protein